MFLWPERAAKEVSNGYSHTVHVLLSVDKLKALVFFISSYVLFLKLGTCCSLLFCRVWKPDWRYVNIACMRTDLYASFHQFVHRHKLNCIYVSLSAMSHIRMQCLISVCYVCNVSYRRITQTTKLVNIIPLISSRAQKHRG